MVRNQTVLSDRAIPRLGSRDCFGTRLIIQGAMTPEVELGAWVIATHKVISKYPTDHPAFDAFDALLKAGKAGDLFSATRALGVIDGEKFEKHRKLARLKPAVARETLGHAERLGAIEISWSHDASLVADRFEFKKNSKKAVLEAVGKLFPLLQPTAVERATVELLSATLQLPKTIESLINELAAKSFKERDIRQAIRLATEIGLTGETQETESGSTLLFNPHSFEGNAKDAYTVLKNLNPTERQKALDIHQFIQQNPGVPLPVGVDAKILNLLVKVGIVDYSKITTSAGNQGAFFATAPHIWDVFDKTAGTQLSVDLIDDAKLLLNSFRYGQYFSTPGRGQIINPRWIVNKLVEEGEIATQKPATAIGEDYPLALSRGIVNIVESPRYPGRYSMELLKTDVAVAVQEVLSHQTILPAGGAPSQEELERAGQFISPSAVRADVQLSDALKKHHDELVHGLRSTRRK